MTIRKEIYTEFDKTTDEFIEKVIVTNYNTFGEIQFIIKHETWRKYTKYEIHIFENKKMQKIFGIKSEEYSPNEGYEIIYNYLDQKTEILHYVTSVKSCFYKEIFPELVNIVMESGLNEKHEFYQEYKNLIFNTKSEIIQEKELVKIEQNKFNNNGHIEQIVYNDLKQPQNFRQEEYFYNDDNKISEIKYMILKNSILHLQSVDRKTYTETIDGTSILTIKWKSYQDKYYISKFEHYDYTSENIREYSFSKSEFREIKVNEFINENNDYSNFESFDKKKLFHNYEEIEKYILNGIPHENKTIVRKEFLDGEIQKEQNIYFNKNKEFIKYTKEYTHCLDKEYLYFTNFSPKERKNCILCFYKSESKGFQMFSSRKFEYY